MHRTHSHKLGHICGHSMRNVRLCDHRHISVAVSEGFGVLQAIMGM